MNSHGRLRRGTHIFGMLAVLFCSGPLGLWAADRFVVPPGTPGGTNAGPYTNWGIAATQIHWAVNAAAAGETVWVTNGTYWLTNEIYAGAITVSSVNGHEVTIVNGNYPAYTNRCFRLEGSTVKGFTIMNGYNTNTAVWNNGGGVYINGGALRNCHVTSNYSAGVGGGVLMLGTVSMYDCLISSNRGTAGGGIYIVNAGCIVSNCVFRGNIASSAGGGVCLYNEGSTHDRSLALINCSFFNNVATVQGGAGSVNGANNIVRNCLFAGNASGWIGGLQNTAGSNGKIQNCTIVRNVNLSGGSSDGLARGGGGGLVENCVLVSNTYSSSALTTNINNRTDTTITDGALNLNNITNNPLFVNYAADDFRLGNNSPCINTGANQDWMTGALDLDGRIRIRYGVVDMGAYEFICAGSIYSCR